MEPPHPSPETKDGTQQTAIHPFLYEEKLGIEPIVVMDRKKPLRLFGSPGHAIDPRCVSRRGFFDQHMLASLGCPDGHGFMVLGLGRHHDQFHVPVLEDFLETAVPLALGGNLGLKHPVLFHITNSDQLKSIVRHDDLTMMAPSDPAEPHHTASNRIFYSVPGQESHIEGGIACRLSLASG